MRQIEMDLDTRRAPPRKKPAGPGLSRLAYRWKRGWGARLRKVGLIYLPVMALGLGAWQAVEMGLWQAHVESRLRAAADAFLDSPDLAIQGVRLTGADPELRAQVSGLVTPLVGTSAMRLDVNELRREIEAMGWIRSAELRRGPQGVLHVSLTKRVPAALWRDDQGILWVVDREGAQIVSAPWRAGYPGLVLLLGAGATREVAEALKIVAAAPALTPRLRALVRVGERRWDVVLDRDQRILLPEEGATRAIARVMAWHLGEDDLLERDLSNIDMRIPERPVLRMTPEGAASWRRSQDPAEGEDT